MDKPSLLEETVVLCTRIEECLRSLGADGSGLYELVESIDSKLPSSLQERIKRVALIRNRFVHEYGFKPNRSEASVLSELDAVIASLHALGAHTRTASTASTRAAPRTGHKGTAMSNTDPWVEIVRNPPKLFRWPSTADERLVLFRGNVAELLPPGKHKIPYFSLISTLAYVRMSPRHVSSAEWQVVSEDEIPLDILAAVTMRVRPDDASVKRIAKAALLSSDAEVALAMDLVFRAVQELVSVTRYADLPALTDVQSRIERAVGGSAQQHLALDILSVTLRAVHSSDPAVREAQLQSLTSAIHLEQMKVDQERERLEYEHRRAQAALDKQAELERLEEERKFAKRLAQDKLEIETINKEHELKRLQMELNAKVAISKHEADAEVAKADKALTHQLLPLVVKSLVAEGKRQVLEGLIKRQYGMSLTAPVEAELSSSDSPETPDGAAVAEDSGSDGEGSDEPETAL